MASVSVFEDKPGADESVRVATKWVQTNMSSFLPNPPQAISGETVAHTISGTKKAAA
jgi:cytochrome c2